MEQIIGIAAALGALALLALALWLPVRLVACLFSAPARRAVRRRWLLHLAWAIGGVAYVGFLLAALQAPRDYTTRAKVYEGLAGAGPVKSAVAARWREGGAFPRSNEQAGVAPPRALGGLHVDSITVSTGGAIVVRYVDASVLPTQARGRTIVIAPVATESGLEWDCTGGDMPAKVRPRSCRAR